MSVDELIEKKRFRTDKLIVLAGLVVAVVVLIVFLPDSDSSSLTVDGTRITIAQVHTGQLEEYVPVTGQVRPKTTVYLDLEEGGIVEKIYTDSGTWVNEGDLILGFSNNAVRKNNIDSETRLLENLNQLRNSKISLTEKDLLLKDQLLDLNYRIVQLQRTFERYSRLQEESNTSLSREQFETTRDELVYLKEKRVLLEERIEQESILRERQSLQVDDSIERVNRSLEILTEIVGSLVLRAPISGYLSSMDAEVGQNFSRGQRVAQIDKLDSFKVTANIDQYYISRVSEGLEGTFQFAGTEHRLRVRKVYSEVDNDAFQVDFEFPGTAPEGIKRGQSLQIDLSLSTPRKANLVSKGGFYRYTNGRWAYRINADGTSADRAELVPGRQNPDSFEVLKGVVPGDWIVSSSYNSFGDVEQLAFEPPVAVTRAR
jgi:HlyD family secretion protein